MICVHCETKEVPDDRCVCLSCAWSHQLRREALEAVIHGLKDDLARAELREQTLRGALDDAAKVEKRLRNDLYAMERQQRQQQRQAMINRLQSSQPTTSPVI